MEQARRAPRREDIDEARRLGMRGEGHKTGLEGLDNVLRLAFAPEDDRETPPADRPGPSERDWVKTLYLVDQASDSLRTAEERIRALESRNDELVRRAADELKSAQSMIHAAETRALRAETRARDADDRARLDREWLLRVHDDLE